MSVPPQDPHSPVQPSGSSPEWGRPGGHPQVAQGRPRGFSSQPGQQHPGWQDHDWRTHGWPDHEDRGDHGDHEGHGDRADREDHESHGDRADRGDHEDRAEPDRVWPEQGRRYGSLQYGGPLPGFTPLEPAPGPLLPGPLPPGPHLAPAGPPPKRRRGLLGVALGCGALLLLGVAGTFVQSQVGMAEAVPQVGECVAVTDDSERTFAYEMTTCGTADSDHRIVQVQHGGASCDGDYSEITRAGTRLCLVPDVVVGDCQRVPGADSAGATIPTGIDTKVPCGSPAADVQVVGAADTTAGESACPEGTANYSVFTAPPKTFCFKLTD
ncbi:LppU/SCO3897 family protein [Saccharopolyspora gregorii]|uniref:Uncharacterized protein n=1 Tax=Saccharopolyspora gregorii TaxID=33914 RepID=A0ABP6RYN0_9PSEU